MAFKQFCNAAGCNAVIDTGEKYCTKHKKDTVRDHSYYDKHKRNKQAKGFYNSVAWKSTRKRVLLRDNGLDVYLFIAKGEIVKAQHVHHIVPREEDKHKALVLSNLISLSNETHSMIEKRYRVGEKDKAAAQAELKEC